MSSQADVTRLFEETHQAFGPVAILVNNADIYQYFPIEETPIDFFQRQFNINVLGSVLTIQAAVKQFGTGGCIILNISSEVGRSPMATGSVYSATKAALEAITTALSKESSGRNIRINSILPGSVEAEGAHSNGVAGSDFEKVLVAKTPLGRVGHRHS